MLALVINSIFSSSKKSNKLVTISSHTLYVPDIEEGLVSEVIFSTINSSMPVVVKDKLVLEFELRLDGYSKEEILSTSIELVSYKKYPFKMSRNGYPLVCNRAEFTIIKKSRFQNKFETLFNLSRSDIDNDTPMYVVL
ncbi:hypothetical protein CDIK_1956 [Cucumispora dikerogammari]|nr:hypothetical protein CDIK_1956 [Cucumispora dikerogammari]